MTTLLIASTAEAATANLKLGEGASFYDHLELIVFGFGWVMLTLMLLSMAIGVVSKILSTNEAPKPVREKVKHAAPVAEPSSTPAAASAAASGIPHHHLAAIAAAVHATLGTAAQVVSIRTTTPGWAQEGRRQHFQSHKVR